MADTGNHISRDQNWVRRVLDEKSFYIAYQPLVDVSSRKVFAYEALLRSDDPDFRGPPDFFEAVISQGCCGEAGRVLRQASIEGCPAWPLFLNIHPNEFDEGFLVRPDDPVFTHPNDIYLEITESVPLSHFQLCHSVLKEVRGREIFLAVDDLGAGYSNLGYIAELAPEVVKLDRELVAGIEPGTRRQRLLRSLVQLCIDQGARVVAEGIETADEYAVIRDAGVHLAQGYWLARPANPPPVVVMDDMLSSTLPDRS